jgi:hypothetical protein
MKALLACAMLLVSLAAAMLLAGCRPVMPPAPSQQVTTANPEDTVTIAAAEGVTVIDIVSPHGIGSAQVQLTPAWLAPMPAHRSLQVRFHLQGLEQATFDNGVLRLTLSVSSHPPYPVSQTLTSNGTTRALGPDDEFWATVTLTPDDATTPTVPLTTGAFVVTLPASFINDASSTLSLRWIDFYRQ